MKRDRREGSATEPSYQRRYADIALPVPVRRLFTYGLPSGIEGGAERGCRARAPFGRRVLTGVIVSSPERPRIESGRIRDVTGLPDSEPSIGAGLLETLTWAARYYVAAPGPVLAMALPPAPERRARTEASY
ncbi:MAG TPA: hypothetical protein VNI57_11750, partial [Candidatus Saccharimonadales bacterium]|nr:hypothetical protein [Candidatus Saccharimonadales bacterium]